MPQDRDDLHVGCEAVNHLFQKGWALVDDPSAPDPLPAAYRPGLPQHFRRPKR